MSAHYPVEVTTHYDYAAHVPVRETVCGRCGRLLPGPTGHGQVVARELWPCRMSARSGRFAAPGDGGVPAMD